MDLLAILIHLNLLLDLKPLSQTNLNQSLNLQFPFSNNSLVSVPSRLKHLLSATNHRYPLRINNSPQLNQKNPSCYQTPSVPSHLRILQ